MAEGNANTAAANHIPETAATQNVGQVPNSEPTSSLVKNPVFNYSEENPYKQFALQKSVISHKDAKEAFNLGFSELIEDPEEVELKTFFDLYNQLFYKIDKRNNSDKYAHYNLIHQSIEYANNYIDYCQPEDYPKDVICDDEIEKLSEGIELINSQSYTRDIEQRRQNLMYPNGTVLRAEFSEGGIPVWIMVQGKKRMINNINTWITAKKALGYPEDMPDNTIVLQTTESELDNIPSGPHIENDIDLVRVDETANEDIDPDVVISDFMAWRESIFVCLCGGGAFDPDDAIDLSEIFSAGQSNNGNANGNCEIVYWDLNSNMVQLELIPGQKTEKIKHRTALNVNSDPESEYYDPEFANFSDPNTPITLGGNQSYIPDGINSDLYQGVYIQGFVREVRFSNDESQASTNQGLEYLTGGDVNGNGYGNDTVHTIEALADSYASEDGSLNFSLYYYNAPNSLGRSIKITIYSPGTSQGSMTGGQSGTHMVGLEGTSKIRAITDSQGGTYWPYPPLEHPWDSMKGTLGYDGQWSIEEGDYSMTSMMAKDPEFVNNILLNITSTYYDVTAKYELALAYYGTGESVYMYGNWKDRAKVEVDYSGDSTNYQIGENVNKNTYIHADRNKGSGTYNGDGHGGGPIIYVNDKVLSFNLNVRYGTYSSYHDRSLRGINVYGAPVFEYQGLYFVLGKHIVDGQARYNGHDFCKFRTALPLYVKPGSKNYNARQDLINAKVMFRMKDHKHHDWESYQNTIDALTNVMNGTRMNHFISGDYAVRCVFPGFDHSYYRGYLQSSPLGDSTPWDNGSQNHEQWDFEHEANTWL